MIKQLLNRLYVQDLKTLMKELSQLLSEHVCFGGNKQELIENIMEYIKRKKCDEEKPFCRRCTSTGRKCDGYAHLSPPQTSTSEDSPPSSGEPELKRLKNTVGDKVAIPSSNNNKPTTRAEALIWPMVPQKSRLNLIIKQKCLISPFTQIMT